ncbi:hypothetical protein BASA61_008202 [Batrachochytrium salamandrivorans]|nr:hypothetical protein BASA61_008202 [Batrachochytrium salamandrivorans]
MKTRQVILPSIVFTLSVQGQLVRSQRWFWSRRTKQLYRNRYWLTPQVRPKTVKQRHSFALMETLRTCGDSASLQKYVTRQLLDTSGFFKDPSFRSIASPWHKISDACAHGCSLDSKKSHSDWHISRHPPILSLITAYYATSNYSAHPLLIFVVGCEQVTGPSNSVWTSINNSDITTQIAGSRTRSGCGECIYLAPRWSLKWRSRSGPALVGRDCGA